MRWPIVCVALSCLAVGVAVAALVVAVSRPATVDMTPGCTEASAYACP